MNRIDMQSVSAKLQSIWNGLVQFLKWLLQDGIDGIGVSAGVLFRAYDFIAGSIYMSLYGWNIAVPGMKPVAAILGFMISWGMFYISHKLVKGIMRKERWTQDLSTVGWIVVVLLGLVAILGDSLFIDSGWVFLAFGIPEFNNPLATGALGIAFSKLSVMGWVFYITSAIMSGLSEFADAMFRNGETSYYVKTAKTESKKSSQWQVLPANIGISGIFREIKEQPGFILVRGDDGELYIVEKCDPRVVAKQQNSRPGQAFQFVN